MRDCQCLQGQTVFIAGGSTGLGKEISKALAAQGMGDFTSHVPISAKKMLVLGAHVTIFARRHEFLGEAEKEVLARRQNARQDINVVSLDLGDADEVDAVFTSQVRVPDILYCVAGGTSAEIGFFTDISAEKLQSCMRNNYFTAAYAAHSTLRLWLKSDRETRQSGLRIRRIVFIDSAAAFLGMPGYAAYTTSKCAVRGLADTLRMEALRLSNTASTYRIPCAFPSNFITRAFLEEQRSKPSLTKQMEGTAGTTAMLERKYPSAEKVAHGIIKGVEKGDFVLCDDSMESSLLFANMIGPSPKRGLGIADSLSAAVVALFIWPILRRRWEKMCREDRWRASETNEKA